LDGAAGSTSGGTSGLDSCAPVLDEGVCIACARRNCCAELLACGRDAICMRDELGCIVRCVSNAVSDGGVADDDTFRQCAGACAVGDTIAPVTNELFACLIEGERTDGAIGADCLAECFDPADAG
jgi:hypothetical protein